MRQRRAARLLVVAVTTIACVLSCPARAGGKRVLFVSPAKTLFGVRVRAEIEAMGFDIETADTLVETAQPPTVAAARVVDSPPPLRVELWIADDASGRLRLRSVIQLAPEEDEAAPTVRASEQLRAFFEPLQASALTPPSTATPGGTPTPAASALPGSAPAPAASATPRGTPTPGGSAPPGSASTPSPPALPGATPALTSSATPTPAPGAPALPAVRSAPSAPSTPPLPLPVEPAPPAGRDTRFAVRAGVGAMFAVGNPGLEVALSARWMLAKRAGIGVLLGLPLIGSTVEGNEGKATVSTTLFGAELSATFAETPAVRLRGSAGFALAWLHTSGVAKAPYTNQSDSGFTGVPLLGVELEPRLTRVIHLSVAGQAGIAPARVDVAFARQVVASWGRPLGMASLGVGVDF